MDLYSNWMTAVNENMTCDRLEITFKCLMVRFHPNQGLPKIAFQFGHIESPVVVHGFLEMGQNDLSGQDGMVVRDIGVFKSRPVLKFHLQSHTESFERYRHSFSIDNGQDLEASCAETAASIRFDQSSIPVSAQTLATSCAVTYSGNIILSSLRKNPDILKYLFTLVSARLF